MSSAPAPTHTLLGQHTDYVDQYNPGLLTPIPRSLGRDAIGRSDFRGTDIWRLYEITWIDERGLPHVAAGELHVPATSPNIVESKSLKLYIGSLTQTVIASADEAAALIARDVGACVGAPVNVEIAQLDRWTSRLEAMPGVLLEREAGDAAFTAYEVDPSLLKADPSGEDVEETLSSDLLRSRCPVTGQPDHASLLITYRGPKIDRQSLLAYVVSYRRHQGFHEQCVESIFTDLTNAFHPESLSVFACFTRRGGIDISPYRSSENDFPTHVYRTLRQ